LDRRSEALALCEGVSEEDFVDGAGEAVLSLVRAGEGSSFPERISCKRELMEAVELCLRQPQGYAEAEPQRSSLLLAALRLLWAGYYREVVLEAKHSWGEEGYRPVAIRRFGEAVLRRSNSGGSRGADKGQPSCLLR
jgi:hypothetical protein